MRKMKDSGVEWIGEIPTNWQVGKTLYALSVPITDGPHETPELFDSGIPFVSAEAVSCGNGHIDFKHIRGYISQEFYDECCKKYIPQRNDIYMIKSGATTGKVAKVETDLIFTIWSPLAVFRCNSRRCHYDYLYYFLQSDSYQKQIENKWTYGTQQNIGMRALEKLHICFPPLDVQYRIADYLNNKCKKIDAIIQKQQSVIEKLKEYKLSVITEAVTKGLDKDVDMTVLSGEWVDSIPAHWKWMSLKSVTEFITCGVAATPEYTDKESGALFLSAQNVKQGVMDYSIERYITKELHESLTKKRKPKRGDLLQVRVGASIGNVAVVDTDEEFSVYVSLTHLRCNEMIKNEFLKFCMMSHLWLQKAFSYVDLAGSQGNLNVADLRILKIPVPPINEQIDIMNYLKTKTNMIDYNIHRKEEILNRLQEYKKSLIYEVVTGKKEV